MKSQDSFSLRADLLIRRTYNRPINDAGTVFETFEQTIDRVIGHQQWLWERAQKRSLDFVQAAELDELRSLMLERKVLTSGRTLWLGGTDVAKAREASQFNPFVAGTKLLTKEHGLVNIEDVDGQSFHVVGRDGKFHEAFGSYSGKQKTYEIFMSRGRSATRFTASENHRWWLEDGSRVPTSSLKIGDKIPVVVPEGVAGTKEGFLHGFIYGDGSVNNKQTGGTYLLRLCGEKSKHFAALSEFATSHSYPPSASGDAFLYFGSISNFREDFKSTPETTDPAYIAGFIRGLMDADGCKDGKQISGSKETIDYIEKYAHLAGLLVTSRRVHKNQETNFGKRSQPLHSAVFSTWDEPMRVRAIEEREVEDVWCCTVPGEESFLLEGGVVTSNCAFTYVETVYDVVDTLWLLMQGCGVGFRPIIGQLTGFQKPIHDIQVIRSTRTSKGGQEHNTETFEDGVWTIKVGDSAEAWSRAVGKLVAHKYAAERLVIDLSEIRPAGERLKGYGWISSGDSSLARSMEAIAGIFNRRAGSLLSRIDLLDLVNWLGTVLSSRRSAEIAIFEVGEAEWEEFAVAKKNWWEKNPQRVQSNNSLLFKHKPSYDELRHIFNLMEESGGSEPGFINAQAATARAPWFKGCNPCVEILLGNKSFCNLTETDVGKFLGDSAGLRRAMYIAARANYRQTCVNLQDGVLQEAWHLNNSFLRLCGVGLTGIATRPDLQAYDYQELQRTATAAAYGMANELGMPHPKNITTIKPSGSLSKVMDTTEGVHKPLGKYIFNNMNFSKYDPLVNVCRTAGYRVFDNPADPDAVLVTFPVKWDSVPFDTVNIKGKTMEVNLESAIVQLNRYKMLMQNWCQQNVSATISYGVEEVEEIIHWLLNNWEYYVGVSFLYRADPTVTAKDLGYLYLPQEVVTKEQYEEYVATLQPINLDATNNIDAELQDDCESGACPIR